MPESGADDSKADKSADAAGNVRFSVSPVLWKYLTWLSEHTVLGKSENEVARQILTDRLAEMREESYRDGR
jgi:hypothetical protein